MNPEPNFYELPQPTPSGEPQPNTPAVPASGSNIVPAPNGSILAGGSVYSPNFSKGNAGWAIDAAGNAEFNDGNFRGDITGATGTFTGAVAASQLNIGGDDATSFHADSGGGIWSGASIANKATAPFRVSSAGALVATNIVATGTINATGGYLGAPTTVLNISTSGLDIGVTGHIQGGASDYLTGIGFFLGYSGAAYKFSVGNPAGNYIGWDGTTLTIVGNQVIVNEYTSGGNTWTKPTGAKTVLVQVWGGGAGGSSDAGGGASGGGGGGFAEHTFNASDLSATVTATVGAGGVAGALHDGNNSTFGSYMTAYGGGGVASGTTAGGGGGGGNTSKGSTSGSPNGGDGGGQGGGVGSSSGTAGGYSVYGGGGGGKNAASVGGESTFGGGGGGGNSKAGGFSFKGGGGGGGAGPQAGGGSVFGGAGGAGGDGVTPASDGAVPGGGGGGASAGGGAGGAGKIRVISYL